MNGRYRVLWKRLASEVQLASFVVQAIERGEDVGAITRAVGEIDRLLESDPQERGESRDLGERILIVQPLAVTFEVFEDERVVVVLRAVIRRDRSS